MGGVTLSSLSITLVCHAPFRPAGGGIVHNDMHGFCGLGGSWEPPWGHRESMRTPHRNALSPTPAKVWAPVTWRSGHITQCPQCSLRESNLERSCCEAAALPLRHCAPFLLDMLTILISLFLLTKDRDEYQAVKQKVKILSTNEQ